MSSPTPDLQSQLLALVSDVVLTKPKTTEDAIVLFEALKLKLSTWLVSELPIVEQKAFLLEQWAFSKAESVVHAVDQEVVKVVKSGCWGKKQK